VDRPPLALDRDQYWGIANTLMNLGFCTRGDVSFIGWEAISCLNEDPALRTSLRNTAKLKANILLWTRPEYVTNDYHDRWWTWSSQHMHTLQYGENFHSPAKSVVTYRCYWMFKYSVLLRPTDCSRVTGVSKKCCAFIFGIRKSPLSLIFKLFHRQNNTYFSLPSFTHPFTFIHSYQQPHFHKPSRATDMYSGKTDK
jgi:hypothetical protein